MAKAKLPKEKPAPKTYTPGQALKVPCINPACSEYFTITPSSADALPSTLTWVCVSCGGIKTKFKMPEEKAEDVKQIPRGQKTL